MLLSAKKFLNRNDAANAGAQTGQAYAAIIILILIYASYQDYLPFCGYSTAVVCLVTYLGLRMGCEYYMGQRWDHFQRKRNALQAQGSSAVAAFEKVRDA